ncbi:isoleucine--tRNA ligase, mitochondrial-like, partial [Amphiura filiformis]|uniref:isoleucine--tRNA ligase, mitochondrial-like n=1 Tax=Amphiura filiformis TaxID=82378 RepID=UPI003B2154F7
VCGFSELYSWQREQQQENPNEFCLHDGPPYANGDPHVGHALNKILKDIINRYRLLQGYKVHYVPGWDCHGLPIELKALSESKGDFRKMAPQDIRIKARKFAKKAISTQMKAFQRWGVMADWVNNCYYTYDKEFEATQLQVFHKMYQKGYVYRDLKPVNWSPSSRTALAEAELEYNPKHISPSVYARFPVHSLPDKLAALKDTYPDLSAIIWTTTPWSIPANEAICYMSARDYAVVLCVKTGQHFMLGAERVSEIAQAIGRQLEVKQVIQGNELTGAQCSHPTIPSKLVPLLPAVHVKMSVGTGFVHTAPAHGAEDYGIGIQHKLPVTCFVDEDGIFTPESGPELAGKNVLVDANDAVMNLLRANNALIHVDDYEHSYPYDWRSKLPIIIRASKQWFVDTEAIRKRAEECLHDVKMYPSHALNSMLSSLTSRTFWCISRQRVWGVPIPVFYNKNTDEPLITKESIGHIIELVKKHGSDCWWNHPVEELLPKEVLQQSKADITSEYIRGDDILDIWFDAGASWAHVLKDAGQQADLYLEGEDQYGAWFQTSLLTSIALLDRAPYKSLLIHGFTLDGEGKKMSKSLGNVIDPDVIVNGRKASKKNKKEEPAYGADVLRWRMAESDWQNRVYMSDSHLNVAQQHVQKIRNTARYLLGNLYDFDATSELQPHNDLLPLDQYLIHHLFKYGQEVKEAYEKYEFDKVTQKAVDLVNNKISAFYLDTVKDRLYNERADSSERRSCQTTLHHTLEVLMRSLAPIIPHLTEDAFFHRGLANENYTSLFKSGWFKCEPEWNQPLLADDWDALCSIRNSFHDVIQPAQCRQYDLVITSQDEKLQRILQKVQSEETSCTSHLNELMMAAFTTVTMATPATVDGSTNVEKKCNFVIKTDL